MGNIKGFSMLELLVAMTILSLITLVANNAFLMFSQKWSGRIGKFDSVYYHLRNNIIFKKSISTIVPYVVKNPNNEFRLYFEGNINGFVGITQNSITRPEFPAVIRVSANLNESSKYDLTYEEWPMEFDVIKTTVDIIPFQDPIILQKNIDNIQFEYLPPKGVMSNVEMEFGTTWQNDYNSLDTMEYPLKMKIVLKVNENNINLVVNLIQPTGAITSLLSREKL